VGQEEAELRLEEVEAHIGELSPKARVLRSCSKPTHSLE
jgi:hypothetical protein